VPGKENKQMSENILEVRNLKQHFPLKAGLFQEKKVVKAVDGISFAIRKGETLGLVGESGCGKSTAGRSILQLYRPTSGQVFFKDQDITKLQGEDLRKMRRKLQMIFQDPYASLNPRMTVGDIIAEPIETHNLEPDPKKCQQRVQQLMARCGLNPAYVKRYPHEFSGGQRQRIGIARALAAEPEFIVADEPISALDVSIQAQIMNLMQELGKERGLTYLFIAHDLAAVRHISDRIAVMYLGRIVELATYDELYKNPQHPYTKALMSAVPIPDPEIEATRSRIVLKGDVPSPIKPPSGCTFHTRCPIAEERCKVTSPQLLKIKRTGPPLRDDSVASNHQVSCHLVPTEPPV
jgi:oligopeptide transport system ATP-binding protein